jgi:uncharacterized GH25 family protein/tetratricopeptide (TPR) repeat protein
MKSRLTSLIFLICSFLSINLFAQLSDKDKFQEALYLMDERRYAEALPMLQELLDKKTDNANLHYNIGVALLNSFHEENKEKALPHLLKAVQNVSPNYTPYSPREKDAPVDAYFYLGRAQHADYQFDAAEESYKKFQEYINDKHYLYKEVQRRIDMSEYAEEAVKNPRNIEVHNLGGNLNSYYPDYSPVIRIDESAIYFTSRRLRPDSSNYQVLDPTDGMYYEDIYVSFNENGVWSIPYPLNINTEGHEATVNLSVDGRTLYLYRDDGGNGELYESKLLSDSAGHEIWSEPKKLGSDINSKAYETHVAISPDGEMLYFVSDREGGYGGKDIYMSKKLPNGKWAAARNAGPVLNTNHDEDGVFMHPDGKTLYFSSNGHPSMGGYDLFTSTKTDTGWTQPENLGYPINHVDDDVFFVTTPDGKRAYFSSFKEGGFGEKDIYMLQLIDADEIALTLYRGEFTLIDSNSPPQGAMVTITNNYTGELVGVYTPRQRDGQFSAILQPNNSYHFVYEADDFETYEEDIYVPAGSSYQEIYKDIKLRPVRVGMGGYREMALSKANIVGKLTKGGEPAAGITITLLNKNEEEIITTVTNDGGGFSLDSLNPSHAYLLSISGDENPNFYTHELKMVNDRDEDVSFDQVDNKTILFVPSKFPYEYYGITAQSLAGTVKSDGKAVPGLKVKLMDENRNVLEESITDDYGEFSFVKLNLDRKYRLLFDGEFPADPEIIIVNEAGQKLRFRQVGDGMYEYVPEAGPAGKEIRGTVMKEGQPIAGMNVQLTDENGNILQQQLTDENGAFIFTNLDLDKKYRIVFDGEFPADPTLIITNEYGQELLFRKVSEGVYEYLPGQKATRGSDIKGKISKDGKPIAGLTVKLQNESNEILQQQVTDGNGGFTFSALDLDRRYRILFDGDFPGDPELLLTNEFGDELLFKRVEDGVYEYIPAHEAGKPTAITGKVSKDGKAIAGLNIILQNENGEVLQQQVTDEYGNFTFAGLDMDRSYRIVFDGDFPDDPELILRDEYGRTLKFSRTGEGVYEYIPAGEKTKSGSEFNGVISKDGKPLSGVKVVLKNKNGEINSQTVTDEVGAFRFTQLDLSQSYILAFEGEVPDDPEIVIRDENGNVLTFVRKSNGEYEYIPGGKSEFGTQLIGKVKSMNEPLANEAVILRDLQGEEIDRTSSDKEGVFTFTDLDLGKRYQVEFPAEPGKERELILRNERKEELTFMKVRDGLYEYIPRPAGFPLKSYTVDVRDEAVYKDTYPRPQELKDVIVYFQKYFPYNAKDITASNKEFVSFINDIVDIIKKRGKAQIVITSSASKVPTKTWENNSVLTKRRAYDTKALLEKVLADKGIAPEQYNMVDVNTLITGPEYRNDATKNRSLYEKYQYVRIFIK